MVSQKFILIWVCSILWESWLAFNVVKKLWFSFCDSKCLLVLSVSSLKRAGRLLPKQSYRTTHILFKIIRHSCPRVEQLAWVLRQGHPTSDKQDKDKKEAHSKRRLGPIQSNCPIKPVCNAMDILAPLPRRMSFPLLSHVLDGAANVRVKAPFPPWKIEQNTNKIQNAHDGIPILGKFWSDHPPNHSCLVALDQIWKKRAEKCLVNGRWTHLSFWNEGLGSEKKRWKKCRCSVI